MPGKVQETMKKIVVYYSLDGNTKAAAERIAGELGYDIAVIEPVKPITAGGFKKILIGGKQAMFNEKPAIKPLRTDLKQYDLIVLGTPVWAGKAAAPVWTFINNCGVCDKIYAVFTLSGSGENVKCVHRLEKKIPDLRVALSLKDKNTDTGGKNEVKYPMFIEAVRVIESTLEKNGRSV